MKLSFLLLFLSLTENYPSDIGISYRPLTWADFRAPVPYNEPLIGARTCVEMDMDTFEANGLYKFKVVAYFLPDSSFVRSRDGETLRHEQTHFKIAYIASLRCNKALSPLQDGDVSAKREADRLYNRYCDERDAVNAQFDAETNHSLNKEVEMRWERRVSAELFELQKKN